MLDLLLDDLVLDAEDEVLERAGDEIVGVEDLFEGVGELFIEPEEVDHFDLRVLAESINKDGFW